MESNYFVCKSRAQLAKEYGISRRTLYTWFKKEQLSYNGKILKPIELAQIYKIFGFPSAEFMRAVG